MTKHDPHDLLWGGVLAGLGLAVAVHAALQYDIGSLRRMGPGFFPVVFGLLLAGLGAFIGLSALGRPGTARPFAWPETVGIVGALLLFGLLLDRLGIVAATAVAVGVSSAVAPRAGLGWRLALTVAVTTVTWVLFIAGLSMTIPVWPWSS